MLNILSFLTLQILGIAATDESTLYICTDKGETLSPD